MFLKKKIQALFLACLCMQPIQATTICDYIPMSITINNGDLIKGLSALLGIYCLARVCRYTAKQAAIIYVEKLRISSIDPALSGQRIGVNPQSGREPFNFLMDLQKNKNEGHLASPLGWAAHKILTAEAELMLLRSPLFVQLPKNPCKKLTDAEGFILPHNGSLQKGNRPGDPQCQVDALLQHTGFHAHHGSRTQTLPYLKTWSQHSIFMKSQLNDALLIVKKDPNIAQILNGQQNN